MNGIMPGPLWLAIASAAKNPSNENGTLTHVSKSDTVAGKMPGSQKSILSGEWKGHGDVEGELHSAENSMERKEY